MIGKASLALNLLLLLLASCAYPTYIVRQPAPTTVPLKKGETQFERGEKYWFVDALGHYLFSLPSKIIFLNNKANNHDISSRTEARLKAYLKKNNLRDVKVRLNQYAPIEEWKRLYNNSDVHWGWRCTFGTLSLLRYTLLPDRLFGGLIGGDHYNPFTNTINIYSDHESIALHEGGHAKDFMDCEWTGGYALLRLVPLVSVFQEYIASEDVMAYHQEMNNTRKLNKDKKILFPALGSYVGGGAGEIEPSAGGILWAGFIFIGHVIGRFTQDEES
jgi:hypothetical protein